MSSIKDSGMFAMTSHKCDVMLCLADMYSIWKMKYN